MWFSDSKFTFCEVLAAVLARLLTPSKLLAGANTARRH